jgi:acyl carrier protein
MFFDFSPNKFYFAPSFNKNTKKMSEIASKVKAIIIDKLGVDEKEVTQEASFTNDLGADSLDTVELIMEFEKEFNIAIPDDQAEKIATVGQAIDYIEKNVK